MSQSSAEVAAPMVANGRTGHQSLISGRRIILVHSSLELGGAEHQSLHLARYLRHQVGGDVQMWGFASVGELARRCDDARIPWRLIPIETRGGWKNRMHGLSKLVWELRSARVDLLLPYCDIPNVLCGVVWKSAGARLCVWNQRGGDILPRQSRLARWALRRAPCIVSNSEHQRQRLVASYDVPAEHTHVIPNGVELPAPRANRDEWRRRLRVGPNDFVACMVANLSSYKDHAGLLRAWRYVLDRTPPLNQPTLLLAGRASDKELELKALCFDLGLGSSVRFMGFVNDVAGLLKASDLCVFSSHGEGMPNGVLEGMAAGLAVVAVDDPSVREALGPYGADLLTHRGDAESLGTKILWAISHPAELAHYGMANADRVRAQFSVDRMCSDTVQLIERELQMMKAFRQ
jgi:glycosyltransferase involved in cell wall biosynthesis